MIKIISTRDYGLNGVKILVYSPAGYGKTVLCKTAPKPIIISAEAGLLSLAGEDIPVIEVKSMEDVANAYDYITKTEEGKKFDTVCVDSITEIAEVMLIEYKKQYKDPRQAYGQLNDDMASLIRLFRDIKDKNVYFTAKQVRIENPDTGVVSYMPGMPGKTLLNGLSFFFDEVFVLRIGQLEDGSTYRYLQTSPDISFEAKDRSGKMLPQAKPDLAETFKIIAGQEEKTVVEEDSGSEKVSETEPETEVIIEQGE